MEVLVYGDRRLIHKKFFKCIKCGAVWSAHQEEYHCQTDSFDNTNYGCRCAMNWCNGWGSEISYEEMVKLQQQSYKEPFRQGMNLN